ncbi:iron-sulfur cluster assembly accessory protein [Ectothiorhodospiraceae bacterium 2226]|nr:iron-sulfur cluster assembly accessory protein [Ectothiorhodospiraceae bacterium 2226]
MPEANYSNTILDHEMRLSEAARSKLAELQADADDSVEAIRVFVSGGGCGGMSYGMTFAEETTAYDRVLEGEGFRLVVDSVAMNYLDGCEIDFDEDTPSFVFNKVFQVLGGSGACAGCGGGAGF